MTRVARWGMRRAIAAKRSSPPPTRALAGGVGTGQNVFHGARGFAPLGERSGFAWRAACWELDARNELLAKLGPKRT